MTNNNQECGDCFEAEEDSIDGFELPLFFSEMFLPPDLSLAPTHFCRP